MAIHLCYRNSALIPIWLSIRNSIWPVEKASWHNSKRVLWLTLSGSNLRKLCMLRVIVLMPGERRSEDQV